MLVSVFRNGWLVLLLVNSICICVFVNNREKLIVRFRVCEKIVVGFRTLVGVRIAVRYGGEGVEVERKVSYWGFVV